MLTCKKSCFQTTSSKRLHGLSFSPFAASESSNPHPSSWASADTSHAGPWTWDAFSLLTHLNVWLPVSSKHVPLSSARKSSIPVHVEAQLNSFAWLSIFTTQGVRFSDVPQSSSMFSCYILLLPKLYYNYSLPFLSPLFHWEFLTCRRL